jgi:Fe-S-cluster-containing hydrogenase component 2
MQQEGETILIDYDKCIQCFCCHELCPSKGITIYKTLLAKMLS